MPRQCIAAAVLMVLLLFGLATSRAGDFDGDGRRDLLIRDAERGVWLAQTTNPYSTISAGVLGGSVRQIPPAYLPESPSPVEFHLGDFDGERGDDLLVYDIETGWARVLILDGVQVIESRVPTLLPRDPLQRVVTVADFDGDDKDDILYQHRDTGAWSLYLSDGTYLKQPWLAESVPMPGNASQWEFVATGHFNPGNTADVLFQNRSSGSFYIQLMNGYQGVVGSGTVSLRASGNIELHDVVDMDQDGIDDLVFRDSDTGAWLVEYMTGTWSRADSGRLTIPSDPGYRLEAIADVNGDGYPDAVLGFRFAPRWRIDLMRGRARVGEPIFVDIAAEQGTQLIAVDDFTDDGRADLLLRTPQQVLHLAVLDQSLLEPSMQFAAWPFGSNVTMVCSPGASLQGFRRANGTNIAEYGTARLSWRTPATRADGESLCPFDIAGYQLSWQRTDTGDWDSHRLNDADVNAYRVDGLTTGTYRFGIRTIDVQGRISQMSVMGSKTFP